MIRFSSNFFDFVYLSFLKNFTQKVLVPNNISTHFLSSLSYIIKLT